MKLITQDDFVLSIAFGDVDGLALPETLAPELTAALIDGSLAEQRGALARLRVVDGEIVDIGEAVQTFYIDDLGQKRLDPAPGRQELACAAGDRLTGGPGTWTVRTLADDLGALAADLRWQLEQAGATWNGWPIHTDAASQGKYLSELQAIALGVRADGDPWKFADGLFRPVANADFPTLAIAAREHVRLAFGIEGAAIAAIAAGTITTEAEVRAAFGL